MSSGRESGPEGSGAPHDEGRSESTSATESHGTSRGHTGPHPEARVASLLPAATEIVCALGAGDLLVGRSHECDYPRGLAAVPVMTSSRLPDSFPSADGASSGDIDRDVRRLLADALAIYELDVDALARARPDVVVTQDLCDVCAVSRSAVEVAVREVLGDEARIVSLHPTRLDDVWGDVRRVAQALGMEPAGEDVVAGLEARVRAIADRAAACQARPTALTIEWIDPVMVGGTWMPELVSLAGGEALVTQPGEHAPTLTLDELAQLRPEVVLVKPCGFSLARSREELASIEALVEVIGPARAFLADGNAYFNRPGPRLVESLEIVAACLHPDEFRDFREAHADAVVAL